jgi:hypothetical protein
MRATPTDKPRRQAGFVKITKVHVLYFRNNQARGNQRVSALQCLSRPATLPRNPMVADFNADGNLDFATG